MDRAYVGAPESFLEEEYIYHKSWSMMSTDTAAIAANGFRAMVHSDGERKSSGILHGLLRFPCRDKEITDLGAHPRGATTWRKRVFFEDE